MKIKLITIFIYFSLTISFAFGQEDFRKGYVITNKGDTLHGYLDFRSDYLNCSKCVFRDTVKKQDFTFLPGEIKGYRFIKNRYFVSTYVPELEKKVFLQFLIDGIVDVYYYKDIKNEYYFVSKYDTTLYLLSNEKKYRKRDDVYIKTINGTVKAENEFAEYSNKHIGILRYLFSDSQNTIKKVNKVNLNQSSLIKIAEDYHAEVCSNEDCIVFEKNRKKTIYSFDILVFVDYSNIEVSNLIVYSLFDFKEARFNPEINYSLGLGVKAIPPRFTEKLALYINLLYNKSNYSAKYIDNGLAGLLNYHYSDIEFSNLNINLGFKYTLIKTKMNPEFTFAWSNRQTFNVKSNVVLEEEFINDFRIREELIKDLDVNYNGITIGTGITVFNVNDIKVMMNLKYDYFWYNIFENEDRPIVKCNTLSAGLGIRF